MTPLGGDARQTVFDYYIIIIVFFFRFTILQNITSLRRCFVQQQPGDFAAVVHSQVQQVRRQHTRPHQQDTEEELRPGERTPADAHANHRQQKEGHPAKAQEQAKSRV